MEYNIRANTYKDFFGSAVPIIFSTAVIIWLGIFLNDQVDLASTLSDVSGTDPEQTQGLGSAFIIVILGLGVVVLLLNYLNVMNIRYTLGEDYIKVKQPQALILHETKEVKFDNITRVYVDKSLTSKILGGGDIVIELTGIKDKSVTLKCIDNPEQVMQFIMQKINEHKMQLQMQYQENKKISGIMQKF